MARWTLLHSDRRARAQWDAGLRWFRLRYDDAADPRRAIELLSGRLAAGRVALVFLPGTEVSRLYVGVPERHTAAWQQLARDFAFSVRREEPAVAQPATALAPAANLPWKRAFVAHVVANYAFVDTPEGSGSYLPQPRTAAMSSWQLPADPPAGLALRPTWNGHLSVPPSLTTGETGQRGWPLGRRPDGALFSVPGPVNVYGGQDAAATWLVQLVAHLLATGPTGLIVLDGAGDLVPVLKRKELVTRRLGQELAYVDIDSMVVGTGFNPLAPLSSETAAATLRRWQHWFEGMGVHPAGLQVLEAAQKAGVADIPGLERWLERPEQQHRPEAAHSIQTVLKRLLADPHLREWLSWPTHPFAGLQPRTLLFACTAGSWARHQVLTAALLAALQIPGARLVLHGLPWKQISSIEPVGRDRLLLTNGPLLRGAIVLLVASEPPTAALLAERFFEGEIGWQENLELLAPGEGIVLCGQARVLTTWGGQTLR